MRARTRREVFEDSIEQLVREQVAAIRARVEAAVLRGLGECAAARSKEVPAAKRPSQLGPSKRRTAQEIVGLTERLYAAVCADPGSTMLQLAPRIGAVPSELTIAVAWLRKQGRLRTVGCHQHTRYFPAAPKTS